MSTCLFIYLPTHLPIHLTERDALLAQEESENVQKKANSKESLYPKLNNASISFNPTTLSSTMNPNHTPAQAYTATNIDDALQLMNLTQSDQLKESDKLDRHPERRVKSAYAAFEEREMIEMKEEHKGLRLTQIKQAIAKKWKKSGENPMNQESNNVSYNASKEEVREQMEENKHAKLDRFRD